MVWLHLKSLDYRLILEYIRLIMVYFQNGLPLELDIRQISSWNKSHIKYTFNINIQRILSFQNAKVQGF